MPDATEQPLDVTPRTQPATSQERVSHPSPAVPPGPTQGRATLSWDTPVTRADGSCLADLAGFEIRWGRDPDRLTRHERPPMDELNCRETGATTSCGQARRCSFAVEGLSPAIWYFVIHAYDGAGRQSGPSRMVYKVIEADSGQTDSSSRQ